MSVRGRCDVIRIRNKIWFVSRIADKPTDTVGIALSKPTENVESWTAADTRERCEKNICVPPRPPKLFDIERCESRPLNPVLEFIEAKGPKPFVPVEVIWCEIGRAAVSVARSCSEFGMWRW